jgi:hypothetical protein
MTSNAATPNRAGIVLTLTFVPVVPGRGLLAREPGIHNHSPEVWIPGSPLCGAPE